MVLFQTANMSVTISNRVADDLAPFQLVDQSAHAVLDGDVISDVTVDQVRRAYTQGTDGVQD